MSSKETERSRSGADLKRVVEEGYNKIAPAYLKFALETPTSRVEAIQKLISLLPNTKDTKVLEVGCGAGVPATQLLAQHFTVTGNDMSELLQTHFGMHC